MWSLACLIVFSFFTENTQLGRKVQVLMYRGGVKGEKRKLIDLGLKEMEIRRERENTSRQLAS